MGLLDGLKELEGAPLPAPATQASNGAGAADAMAAGAKSVLDGLGHAGGQLRRFLGDEEEAPSQATMSDEVNALCSLTWIQRMALFAMTFGSGVLMIMTSVTFLPLLVIAPHKFAASFTMGNVLAIVSTWLLVGPRAQIAAMFQPNRAVPATAYVVSLVAVLGAAFFGGALRYPLVLVALVVEIVSRALISRPCARVSPPHSLTWSSRHSRMVRTHLHTLWAFYDIAHVRATQLGISYNSRRPTALARRAACNSARTHAINALSRTWSTSPSSNCERVSVAISTHARQNAPVPPRTPRHDMMPTCNAQRSPAGVAHTSRRTCRAAPAWPPIGYAPHPGGDGPHKAGRVGGTQGSAGDA